MATASAIEIKRAADQQRAADELRAIREELTAIRLLLQKGRAVPQDK